jgi:hypothetical protein
MAEVTKTILYPVPTEFYGDDQDTTRTGIVTYTGPDRITIWYEMVGLGTDGREIWSPGHVFPSDPGEDRDAPVGTRVKELSLTTHPLHTIAHWQDGYDNPNLIETPAGPSTKPNPIIPDYLHFNEVFDMRSFEYDFDADRWMEPRYSGPHTECDEFSDGICRTKGWEWVRRTRDSLLEQSDTKIPADAPEAFSAEWRTYRQALRDIPQDWASVGENTYLIVWPREPGDLDKWRGISPETGLESTDVTTDETPMTWE